MNVDNLDIMIRRQIRRTVSQVLETNLSKDPDDEKKRQERMAAAVKERGLDSSKSDAKKKKEADEEDETPKDEDKKEKREDRTGGKGTADSPKLDEPGAKAFRTPSIGSVIDKLNALRGGKSLKDPDVKVSFTQYFEGLSENERRTLLAFLTGIAQILSGVKQGDDALEPGDIKDLDVEKKKEKKQSKSKETGSVDNPIVVGEKRLYDVNKVLSAYRKNK